jgi:tripartite-type tricarboxylate transporter receptor subunit TctC
VKLLPHILLVFSAHTVHAQDYPTRPVRLLVGLGPGGGSDTVARVMTIKLTEILRQSLVVDNRPSAGGAISSEIVAKAAPDGYTLLAMSPTHVITPSLRSNAGNDPIRDFAPIALTVFTPYVLSCASGWRP